MNFLASVFFGESRYFLKKRLSCKLKICLFFPEDRDTPTSMKDENALTNNNGKRSETQKAKAARVGVTPEYYNSVINRKKRPSYHLAKLIAAQEGVHFLFILDPSQYDTKGKKVKTDKNARA